MLYIIMLLSNLLFYQTAILFFFEQLIILEVNGQWVKTITTGETRR